MFIRMITTAAGPEGVHRAGKVVEVGEREGRRLIDARAASECDPRGRPIAQKAIAREPETPEAPQVTTRKGARNASTGDISTGG